MQSNPNKGAGLMTGSSFEENIEKLTAKVIAQIAIEEGIPEAMVVQTAIAGLEKGRRMMQDFRAQGIILFVTHEEREEGIEIVPCVFLIP